jgi:hypothetical protein
MRRLRFRSSYSACANFCSARARHSEDVINIALPSSCKGAFIANGQEVCLFKIDHCEHNLPYLLKLTHYPTMTCRDQTMNVPTWLGSRGRLWRLGIGLPETTDQHEEIMNDCSARVAFGAHFQPLF